MKKDLLKQIIDITGLSQREFANQIKSTEFQVSNWLAGRRNIRNERLEAIAKQFNLKITYKILAQ
jgi:transcriptional regulator with XRE-family HTH domain